MTQLEDSIYEESIEQHRRFGGKWEVRSKFPLRDTHDLSLAYTPGVASVCKELEKNPASAYELSMKGNSVAIVSDGSSVLGLGDIGPLAALPVMEGKAILFKAFANIDGVPLVVDTKSKEDLITTVKTIAPNFGGINLEDIKAPMCFEVEEALQDIGIPVFHDDQHGTAIVLLAALINACKATKREQNSLKVVINGAGAAGTAIGKLLTNPVLGKKRQVKNLLMCDSKGIICDKREDLNATKKALLTFSNPEGVSGDVKDAIRGADVFIGVSRGGILDRNDIATMNKDPIIFAMANPEPEIHPEEAMKGGAAVVGTGRSDYPNQINNVLAFPGIFRGALDAKAKRITESMQIAAATALAQSIGPIVTKQLILPKPLNLQVASLVATAVAFAANNSFDMDTYQAECI